MYGALSVAKTGLDAHQKNLAVISNNLANVNTTGYKQGKAEFESLFYQNIQQPGAKVAEDNENPTGLLIGTGVKMTSASKIFTNGTQQQTGNDLDIAIQGRGFLPVLMPGNNEIGYTRAGHLQKDGQGQLVTANGLLIQPPITIPQGTTKVTISSDGIVSALVNGNNELTEVGRIELADFINPAGLKPIGGNLYTATDASGEPQQGQPGANGLGTVVQGALESSNVNVVEEMVNLIQAQRAFEVMSKAVSAADQMQQFFNQQT